MDFGPEKHVHGAVWGRQHGGYFSDPEVARPLVAAVRKIWAEARPDRIVDLGGGTGFLLAHLRAAGIGAGAALTVLDDSAPQLAEAAKAGLACVRGSAGAFRRTDVAPAGARILWLMRSVLHYAGAAGLDPLLRHLRDQAAPGECWVHQTACFECAEDAARLNALYAKMRTAKWYPTIADLQARLAAAGWTVDSVRPAPTLALDSAELAARYELDEADVRRIAAEMASAFGADESVFRRKSGGFSADVHYRTGAGRAG